MPDRGRNRESERWTLDQLWSQAGQGEKGHEQAGQGHEQTDQGGRDRAQGGQAQTSEGQGRTGQTSRVQTGEGQTGQGQTGHGQTDQAERGQGQPGETLSQSPVASDPRLASETRVGSQPSTRSFDPDGLADLPDCVRAYFEHSIQPGTPLASAVRLRMHGEIKIKAWRRFKAEQVISWNQGMIWRARVWMMGMPILGGDYFVEGQGSMRWKLLGLLPIVDQAGPDITRSTAGRINIESVWLPSVLCGDEVTWTGSGNEARASFLAHGDQAEIDYRFGPDGALQTACMERWGDPDGGEFGLVPFGALVEEEGWFEGYRIPTRLRVGWHLAGDHFDKDGEFFRVTIDEARFR